MLHIAMVLAIKWTSYLDPKLLKVRALSRTED